MFAFLRRIIFPHTYNSDAYIRFLRKKGVKVGEGCIIYSPNKVTIDVQRPHMLKIGSYVKISAGVVVLCHDYSRGVFCNLDGCENVGECKKTTIGNNCFIGTNAIILMGANIGNNCIIGAGSVVTAKEIPDSSVVCGNPARIVSTVQDYYLKQFNSRLDNAKLFVNSFIKTYNRKPKIEEMTNAFFWLYLPHTKENVELYDSFFNLGGVNKDVFVANYLNTEPLYKSFEDFLQDCEN